MYLERAASAVLEQESKISGRKAAIDPDSILSIVTMIMDIFSKCKENRAKTLIKDAKNPNIFQRASVLRSVSANSETRTPLHQRRQRADAFFAAMAAASPADVEGMISEINS